MKYVCCEYIILRILLRSLLYSRVYVIFVGKFLRFSSYVKTRYLCMLTLGTNNNRIIMMFCSRSVIFHFEESKKIENCLRECWLVNFFETRLQFFSTLIFHIFFPLLNCFVVLQLKYTTACFPSNILKLFIKSV